MMIAIPLEDGKLCPHFGHCAQFAFLRTDDKNEIVGRNDVAAPPHEPGLLPVWLQERGIDLILCGGMGPRALELFAQKKIEVVVGVPASAPEEIVRAYFAGTLQKGGNSCDH